MQWKMTTLAYGRRQRAKQRHLWTLNFFCRFYCQWQRIPLPFWSFYKDYVPLIPRHPPHSVKPDGLQNSPGSCLLNTRFECRQPEQLHWLWVLENFSHYERKKDAVLKTCFSNKVLRNMPARHRANSVPVSE